MSIQNILLVTDLSERSERAMARAVQLARQFGAALRILHVLDEDLPPEHLDQLEKGTAHRIRETLSEVAHAASLDVEIQVEKGKGFQDILRFAEQEAVDLVVMGTHRPDFLKDMFIGSTAEQFLRHTDYPVLTVTRPADGPYRKVLAAIDFSICSRRALETALDLLPEGEFHLVHAYHSPAEDPESEAWPHTDLSKRLEEEVRQRIQEEFGTFLHKYEHRGFSFHTEVIAGEPLDVLNTQVQKLDPDLLTVGTHGRTGVGRALLGSVASRLLHRPPTDILAVRAW